VSGFLLDTHVWLWHLRGDESLSAMARRLVDTSLARCWLSPISIWETGVLRRRGRIESDRDWRLWIGECERALPLRYAPVTDAVAVSCLEVDLPHDDPADRLIAATAVVYDLTLITADRRLLECSSVETFSARR
jgi:PIN domain nuclease of toxin-antitoxin system